MIFNILLFNFGCCLSGDGGR